MEVRCKCRGHDSVVYSGRIGILTDVELCRILQQEIAHTYLIRGGFNALKEGNGWKEWQEEADTIIGVSCKRTHERRFIRN